MSKFARSARPRAPLGPVTKGADVGALFTHQGGEGYALDPKGELYKFAVCNLVGESTFYETATDRDRRYVDLVQQVTKADPKWIAGFVPWLRDAANLRSAPLVMALEYIRAGGPDGAAVLRSAMRRGDEPAEALAYWHAKYGRKMPQAVRKGIASGARDLYNESTVVRYDSSRSAYRPSDVLELTHPKPKAEWQSQLFKFMIDRRHGRDDWTKLVRTELRELFEFYKFESVTPDTRQARLASPGGLPKLANWEHLGSWLPNGWTAEAWELVIPQMGYMALLRNLRNFDKASLSAEARQRVVQRLTDPEAVKTSRQLPMRFYSAWKAVNGDRRLPPWIRQMGEPGADVRWGVPLETALQLSLANVPEFSGNTLVMVDHSGSMMDKPSAKSELSRSEVALVFAGAISARNPGRVAVVPYHTTCIYGQDPTAPVRSILRFVEEVSKEDMGGTDTWGCLADALPRFPGVSRVVVVTDEQVGAFGRTPPELNVPLYVWNLGGYAPSSVEPGPGVYVLGGLSDASFSVVPLLEAGRDAKYPWE